MEYFLELFDDTMLRLVLRKVGASGERIIRRGDVIVIGVSGL